MPQGTTGVSTLLTLPPNATNASTVSVSSVSAALSCFLLSTSLSTSSRPISLLPSPCNSSTVSRSTELPFLQGRNGRAKADRNCLTNLLCLCSYVFFCGVVAQRRQDAWHFMCADGPCACTAALSRAMDEKVNTRSEDLPHLFCRTERTFVGMPRSRAEIGVPLLTHNTC